MSEDTAQYPAEKLVELDISVCSNGYLITKKPNPMAATVVRTSAIDSWVAQGGIDVLCEVLGRVILDRDPT